MSWREAMEKNRTFRSFEQFKAEIFPELTRQQESKGKKADYEEAGIVLADSIIEGVLNKKKEARNE